MTDLVHKRHRVTRSISPENPSGRPGAGALAHEGTGANAARDLGVGWKVSPSVVIPPGHTQMLAEIDGPGRITHIWMTTHHDHWRSLIFRAEWDGAPEPAVEVPYGDFFGNGWCEFAPLSSSMIAANPSGGFNSYWPMPFAKSARLTLENLSDSPVWLYFQITYDEGPEDAESHYFHAQWRRSNPLTCGSTHTLLAAIEGSGHYVGTYMAWGSNSNGWWGEGEMKFYMDEDLLSPTICGTGTEDYFGGAWNFDVPGAGYTTYSTPYLGLHQVLRPDGLYRSQQRFGMYRWHVMDPISFNSRLSLIEVQALGWRAGWRYLQLEDDIASTAFLYLDRPQTTRPPAPDRDLMEVQTGSAPAPDLGLTPPKLPPH